MLKISLITPSLNQGAFIREAIESVLVQNDPCFEHIVVDGGSSDGTLDLLKSYPHIQWISEPDSGQSDAVNKGFAMATGDVIGEINADDYYLPGALAVVRREMDNNASCDAITGGQLNIRNGLPAEVVRPTRSRFEDLLRYPVNPVSHPATFVSRRAWLSAGGMDANIRYAPDVDFLLRLSKVTEIRCVKEVMAVNRIHEAGIQGRECKRNWLATLYHIARHGPFAVFEEMTELTYSWLSPHQQTPSEGQDENVSLWLHQAYISSILTSLQTSHARVVLAGAGKYATWLLTQSARLTPKLDIKGILDDGAHPGQSLLGYPVLAFGGIDASNFDCLLVASDAWHDQLVDRIAATYGSTINVLDPFKGIPKNRPLPTPIRDHLATHPRPELP